LFEGLAKITRAAETAFEGNALQFLVAVLEELQCGLHANLVRHGARVPAAHLPEEAAQLRLGYSGGDGEVGERWVEAQLGAEAFFGGLDADERSIGFRCAPGFGVGGAENQ
jgi:hypothetical protein